MTLALQEVRQYGERSIQIARRLRSLIEDLKTAAPPSRRPVLDAHAKLLEEAVRRAYPEAEDRALAREADDQGLE